MGITCCKGMRDILPAEIDSWYNLENTAFRLVEAYGYKEIRTPVFECKDLYATCIGRDSGMVQNKLWTIKGQGGENVALCPDYTASVMRAYCEHHLYREAQGPTKLFYLGPIFLHGNSRQATCWQGHQFGLEALGTADPASDTEVIMLAHDLCQALGLPKVRVHLNTMGCPHCRPAYQQMLTEFFARHAGELCDTCRGRYKNRPQWIMGCCEDKCRSLAALVPSIHGYLCEECEAHFKAICKYLSELKVDYVVDPLTSRDVDCYNRTIFSIACAGRLVAFGGRYDGMAGRLVNDTEAANVAAVGCSVDVETLLNLIDDLQIEVGKYTQKPKVCFVGDGQDAVQLMLPILYALRRNGIVAELLTEAIPDNDQDLANISPARFVLALSDDNVRVRKVTLFDGDINRADSMSFDEALTIIGRDLGLRDLSAELRPVDMRHWSIATRNHHSLDGASWSRRQSEPKTRSRSRRMSLKTEQLLVPALREGRGRKVSRDFAVPTTREKSVSSRVRKRRRPENENSLETATVVPAEERLAAYPEPMVTSGRRDKHESDMVRTPKSTRRSRGESGSTRERGSDRLGLGRERLNFSAVESLAYGSRGSRKRLRLGIDNELCALNLDGANGERERILFSAKEEDLGDMDWPNSKHGKRHTRGGKDSQRLNDADPYFDDLSLDSGLDDEYIASDVELEEPRPNVIEKINRWASERYGIEEDAQFLEPISKRGPNSRRNNTRGGRGGRKILARNRESQVIVAPETYRDPTVNIDEVEELRNDVAPDVIDVSEAALQADNSEAIAESNEKAAKPARQSRRSRSTGTRKSRKAEVVVTEESSNVIETVSVPVESHDNDEVVEAPTSDTGANEENASGNSSGENSASEAPTPKRRQRSSAAKRQPVGRRKPGRRATAKGADSDKNNANSEAPIAEALVPAETPSVTE